MLYGFSGNFGYTLPPDWAYDQFVTRTVGTGSSAINIDNNIASGRDIGQNSFNSPRVTKPDVRLDPSLHDALLEDVGKYMESIGMPDDGGVRSYQHWKYLQTTVFDHDQLITNLSTRYNMRKALIQTTAYWEMRHIDPVDLAAWESVKLAYTTTGEHIRDSSTGIAKQRAFALIGAWNHGLTQGYVTGRSILDFNSDDDKYSIWRDANEDEEFALTSVAVIHMWDIDGKPGENDDSPSIRRPTLDYTEDEICEVLRRYQGPEELAFSEASGWRSTTSWRSTTRSRATCKGNRCQETSRSQSTTRSSCFFCSASGPSPYCGCWLPRHACWCVQRPDPRGSPGPRSAFSGQPPPGPISGGSCICSSPTPRRIRRSATRR